MAKLTAPPINSINVDGSDIKIGYNMALTLIPPYRPPPSKWRIVSPITPMARTVITCYRLRCKKSPMACMRKPWYAVSVSRWLTSNLRRVCLLALTPIATVPIMAIPRLSPQVARYCGKRLSKAKPANHALYQTVYPGSTVKTVQDCTGTRQSTV